MILSYELIEKKDLVEEHKIILADLLKKQGKVKGPFSKKADRCEFLCIAKYNNKPVAIGAIKKKTKSDFNSNKADLQSLEKLFDFELGYLYTSEEMSGKGIASQITKLLISNFKQENLMASTEISANISMEKILIRNGFEKYGKPYKSERHDNVLSLYLKFGIKTA